MDAREDGPRRLGAVYVGVTTVVWVLAGMPHPVLGAVDKAVQVVLVGLFVHLLVGGVETESSG